MIIFALPWNEPQKGDIFEWHLFVERALCGSINVFSTSGFGQGEVKSSSSYVAAKYAVPLNERLSAYGKLGVARNERKVNLASNGVGYSDNDNGVYGAVGLQYALGQNLSLVGEYERYGKQPEIGAKADVVSVGLKVGF
ncbi:outer membrane beta-barrel protein [Massilia aurea]|uniref:outer membrane beta-barrel protein n=1 Tax=Massilia aurea TaxID=373040 RepID=UPI0022772FA8|nr:outer membrane beta-barrel protein [Massilia aurea]